MPNRLSESNSPYLLQHQDNPVDWYPWGEEALQRAKDENKPIFLSVGYAACHWCHVMAHESFEDQKTADIMNEHFINIKVDREERPDIDGIYMDAVVALSGSGGWPMSVFLMPDGKPFLGGTYYPPEPRHNLPSFKQLLEHVTRIWNEEYEKVSEVGDQLLERLLANPISLDGGSELEVGLLQDSVMGLAQSYDWTHGGWGRAPKFPQAMVIDFLLARSTEGDKMAQDMAEHALSAMAQGGMHDELGGGFARYSVDDIWLIPHFEKMLYDNALLSRNYLHAYLVSNNSAFKQKCESTLDFVARELHSEEGAFFSSLDADSEGEEGKFYVWTYAEIQTLIPKNDDFQLLSSAYEIEESGNFEGHIVLRRRLSDDEIAKDMGFSKKKVHSRLEEMRTNLLTARSRRIRPGTDDKAICAWNAEMMKSFAEAGRYLNREDYTQIAIENADFILENFFIDGRLHRSWRNGKAAHKAFLEDYAALILALLSLYQSDPNPKWYEQAEMLTDEMIRLFAEGEEFFDTGKDQEQLVTRPRDLQDNATPSGNSMATLVLLQMHSYSGKGSYYDLAIHNLQLIQQTIARYPTGFGVWLQAIDFALADGNEIAILGETESAEMKEMVRSVWANYRPNDVVAVSEAEPPPGGPPLLDDRPLLDGKASAYVCQHFVCKRPVSSAKELSEMIK